MKTNQQGVDLIKSFETLQLKAYLPTPNDRWTIGYGNTFINGKPVTKDMVIDAPTAEALFVATIESFERGVDRLLKRPLSSNQYSAVISFVYNIGINNFANSTLLRKINGGDFQGAANEFLKWNKQAGKVLRGLTRRREAEKSLFLS